MKKTIAIDLDDVIADSTDSLRLLVNERFDVNLTKDHYRIPGEYWGYYERVWREHSLDKIVNFKELNSEMAISQAHVPLLAGASYGIHELSKSFNVVIITSRDISWKNATRQWLDMHFPHDNIEVYFAGHHHTGSHETKGQICKKLKATILIDDNVAYCQSAIDEGVKAILFGEYGWHGSPPENLVRCKDWPSVIEYIYG